ncbi:hypothetical protein GCM10027614_82290 [Micromonospora vulcania]
MLAGRALDGEALRTAIGSAQAPKSPPGPAYDVGDQAAVRDAAGRYARWWDARFAATSGAWLPGRLAAPFRLAASTSTGPTALVAPEHRGGRIDWHSFDGAGSTSMAAADAPSAPVTTRVLPNRLSFPGMPRPRWWEFEDAAVDLGRIDAAPDDLGRLLLAEFALVYGNDFFAVPMSMAAGSLCRVVTIEVDTCFDETVTVPSAVDFDGPGGGRRAWRMFHSDGAAGLVLAPSIVDVTEGASREEVLLSRDEMANLAWAVELRVTGPTGTVVDRREVESARQARAGDEPTVENALHYRLSTTVPESWLPLLPEAGGVLALPATSAPAGRLLGDQQSFRLDAIELPRVGRRVTLVPRRARAVDGTIRVWSGWHVGPGRGRAPVACATTSSPTSGPPSRTPSR